MIAESVAGDREDPSALGSATTRVDCKRKPHAAVVLRSEVLTGETAERRRDNIMVEDSGSGMVLVLGVRKEQMSKPPNHKLNRSKHECDIRLLKPLDRTSPFNMHVCISSRYATDNI